MVEPCRTRTVGSSELYLTTIPLSTPQKPENRKPKTKTQKAKTMVSHFIALASVASACLIAVSVQVLLYSPIDPLHLDLPSSSWSNFPSNNVLQRIEKLGDGVLESPEDVCVDEVGLIYTATRDGWIKRMHKNGSWENWKLVGGSSLLGLTISIDGDVLVCDAVKGLLKVSNSGVTVLTNEVEGSKIRFADAVIQARDGSVYMSDASTKFGFDSFGMDLLEARPNGRLLKYDPASNTTTLLLPDLFFANGVALSSDQDFLIVCETWKFRCLKHWLDGESKGQTEIFIDNLPGGPDNVNLAEDGSFWIALIEIRSRGLDIVHKSKLAKKVVGTFPKLLQMLGRLKQRAAVVNVGADGKIRRVLDDCEGKVISFVTSAVEFEGSLYLGNLAHNFIGKLPLNMSI